MEDIEANNESRYLTEENNSLKRNDCDAFIVKHDSKDLYNN
jgi:hypothetical protein